MASSASRSSDPGESVVVLSVTPMLTVSCSSRSLILTGSRSSPITSSAELIGVDERARVVSNDDELVATHARDGVARPQPGPEPIGDGLQRLVAARVTDTVVDLLEVIDVDDGDRHETIDVGERHRRLEAVVEAGPIGELSE